MSIKLMSAVLNQSTRTTGSEHEGEKLLKQLLESVQQCQKRYGGKTELATEYDNCVAALCLSLESVFSHGLRNLTLKNFVNANSNFWPFVKHHLTKHERERYEVLKQIWTDTGRGRAFLRSALNERSLERYFHIFLGNNDVLKEYYEPWAVLRDDERNSMLPNMAAGLGSILFATSIDKPELNSSVPTRPGSFRTKVEPIIEAPVPEARKDKRKHKVARQYISFDDDDTNNAPSSCSSSSTASEISSITEIKTKNERSYNKKFDKKTMNPERKLSFENSGSRDKFPASTPETLTPVQVQDNNIGELMPVSVEMNKDFDSSDEIFETPTDISALLTAVELKNNEELIKKDEKIRELIKENSSLKQQVDKYLSAIRMLKNDDKIENLNDIEHNYRDEAKIFEMKLVQVADMHAELIDFNVMLQQKLCQKELVLERLKNELEMLRGPGPVHPLLSNDDDDDANKKCVNVWIPSAFLTGTGSSSHHVYQIFLRAGNDEWNIYRRYAQFHALHTDLKKLDPTIATFDFPPKKSLRNKDSALVEERRKRLQTYLRRILQHWPELSHCNSRYLLEQHLAFFKDQKDDLNKTNSFSGSRRSPGSSHSNSSGL